MKKYDERVSKKKISAINPVQISTITVQINFI